MACGLSKLLVSQLFLAPLKLSLKLKKKKSCFSRLSYHGQHNQQKLSKIKQKKIDVKKEFQSKHLGGRGRHFSAKFENSLVYIVNSKTVPKLHRYPVSTKKQTKTKGLAHCQSNPMNYCWQL